MKDRRFVASIRWDYACENPYEECYIYPATEEDEVYDGWNFVTGGARDGASIDIYPNLEEAIIKSHFNPHHIDFSGLTEEEIKYKDNFLESIIWDPKVGIRSKDGNKIA